MISLLWAQTEGENNKPVSILEDALFNDLKITKLLENVFDNYSDVDEVIQTMKKVPDTDSLKLRQGIMTDVLEDKENVLDSLYYDLVDLVGRYISLKEAIEITKKKVFLIMYYHHYYLYLEKVINVLQSINVKSTGLNELMSLIKAKLELKSTKELRGTVDKFYNYIMNHFAFNVEYHDGAPYYRLSFEEKENLEDNLMDIVKGLNINLLKTPRQIVKHEINPYFLHEISLNDSKVYDELGSFYEEHHQHVDDLTDYISEFKYYLFLKTVFHKINAVGIPYCMGEISQDNITKINDAYDISLTVSGITVIPNDFYVDGKENISFILGVNSGGKTCYLRSVATNYVYFMTCGYLFAKSASIYPVKYICTHFPNEENYSFGEGRLRDEIRRLDVIKKTFSPESIAFLNETFSSTSEERACVLTKELLASIGTTGAKVMYVTHQYKIFEEIQDDRIGFYTPVVVEGKENIRTHKIKKVEKKLLSYVDDILYKHGLTKNQLLERRTQNE